jgi:hypothetical protein
MEGTLAAAHPWIKNILSAYPQNSSNTDENWLDTF